MRKRWEMMIDGEERTERLRVDGGYLYRTIVPSGNGVAVAMEYVPDPPKRAQPRR